MKLLYIKNEKGIALVMVLILALIGLAIVSALLYMMTQATTMSGAQKFYRTAEEASYGGMELSTGYIAGMGLLNIPLLPGIGFTAGCNCRDPYVYNDNIDNMTDARSDRCDKLCNPTANWPAGVDEGAAAGVQVSLDPTKMNPITGQPTYDMRFTLGGAPTTFEVFAKIVDTVQGNSDVGGIVSSGELQGSGVVAATSGLISPPHSPYLYRLEVQSQSTANPRERARLSILYAF